jgi:hypothetical protein
LFPCGEEKKDYFININFDKFHNIKKKIVTDDFSISDETFFYHMICFFFFRSRLLYRCFYPERHFESSFYSFYFCFLSPTKLCSLLQVVNAAINPK